MVRKPRHKLALGCALLGASMLPLAVEPTWNGVRLTEPVILVVTLLTGGLALWAAFASRVAWVLVMLRAGLQVLATLLLLSEVSSYSSRATFLRTQAGVSLALTVASMWLLCSGAVRTLVWRTNAEAPELGRPLSRIATRRVLSGLGTSAVLMGSIEQAWIYQHLSLLELGLRSLYLLLPWAGAWQLAKLGRDRVIWTTLGALLGELVSELVSLVASGAAPMTVVAKLLLPLDQLPVLILGLALAVFGPARPLWQLLLALPLAQLVYREVTVMLTSSGGLLSWQAAVVAGLSGVCCALDLYLFRRPAVVPRLPPPDGIE